MTKISSKTNNWILLQRVMVLSMHDCRVSYQWFSFNRVFQTINGRFLKNVFVVSKKINLQNLKFAIFFYRIWLEIIFWNNIFRSQMAVPTQFSNYSMGVITEFLSFSCVQIHLKASLNQNFGRISKSRSNFKI